jgi:uncharacterized protein YbjT (DUF2867 family)
VKKILLAGATGYLGNYILEELLRNGYPVTALLRNKSKLKTAGHFSVKEAAITDPAAIRDCCHDTDVVISTVGITRQKDHLTYMDVDYQANLNLLEEARRSGVKKFIYVSVLHGRELRRLKICDAKERFVEALEKSGLDYCVIRPTGFFSDMLAYLDMARKGRVFLFGNGAAEMNPVHGADLAGVCVSAINNSEKEIPVGGPQVLTQQEIAATAFAALDKKAAVTHLPSWIKSLLLFLLRACTSSKTYGPVEFALTVITTDMVAPPYGKHTLLPWFREQLP